MVMLLCSDFDLGCALRQRAEKTDKERRTDSDLSGSDRWVGLLLAALSFVVQQKSKDHAC